MPTLKKIEPATAAVMIAGIAAITIMAIFAPKVAVAIAGALGVIAAAVARSLLKQELDTVVGPDASASATDEAAPTARKPPMGGGSAGNLVVFLLVAAFSFGGTVAMSATSVSCTPQQAQEVKDVSTSVENGVDEGCKVVQAVTTDNTVKSVCATATEIGLIANLLASERPDGGALARPANCVVLPTTTFCATTAETLRGIDEILAQRRAWFSSDAGKRQ